MSAVYPIKRRDGLLDALERQDEGAFEDEEDEHGQSGPEPARADEEHERRQGGRVVGQVEEVLCNGSVVSAGWFRDWRVGTDLAVAVVGELVEKVALVRLPDFRERRTAKKTDEPPNPRLEPIEKGRLLPRRHDEDGAPDLGEPERRVEADEEGNGCRSEAR